ncbi:suppressor of fused domain protein [Tautonia sp. JC769]|uniref:suppressor of fused domain protein n=1 Tax=Tautonia sp. JC769 TaxID=3232135 RepID=UPI003457E863
MPAEHDPDDPESGLERSASGSPIYRHQPPDRDWSPPESPALFLEEIEAHLERHIGGVEHVFHEVVSDLVHLDVLLIPPADDRPFKVLVTSGVSERPMAVPEGLEEFRRAELMIALPPDWPLSEEALRDEANYWPIRWLKTVGRLPHEYQTWIGWGHSIPNGDPAEPIGGTGFVGVVLLPPYGFDPEIFRLDTASGEPITFYWLVPLYPEEMAMKLDQGIDAIEDRFDDIGFVLDPDRPNVALDNQAP